MWEIISKGGTAVIGVAAAEDEQDAIHALSSAQLGSASPVAAAYTKKSSGSGSNAQGCGGNGGKDSGTGSSSVGCGVHTPHLNKSWNSHSSKGWGKGKGWRNGKGRRGPRPLPMPLPGRRPGLPPPPASSSLGFVCEGESGAEVASSTTSGLCFDTAGTAQTRDDIAVEDSPLDSLLSEYSE